MLLQVLALQYLLVDLHEFLHLLKRSADASLLWRHDTIGSINRLLSRPPTVRQRLCSRHVRRDSFASIAASRESSWFDLKSAFRLLEVIFYLDLGLASCMVSLIRLVIRCLEDHWLA